MPMQGVSKPFTAVILAADRETPDPVAQSAAVRCKALAPVDGKPMVARVLNALSASTEVSESILCGPDRAIVDCEPFLQELLQAESVQWMPSRNTPSTSAYDVLQQLPADQPVLLTTADHALLRPAIVDHFCHEARLSGCDVVIGLASYEAVMAAYPGMRRTATRFADGPFCGCNLFSFLTPQSRAAADFWRQVERDRKKPLKMLNKLGWIAVLKYLLGALSLTDGLDRISRRLGLRAGAVILPFPEAAVDVDTPADWQFVQGLSGRQHSRN